MTISTSGVLGAITRSSDTGWLKQCADHNVKLGRVEIAEAANQRIRDLELTKALKIAPGTDTLEKRVLEALRVSKEFLKHKHGRNPTASATERDIKKLGEKDALIKTIRSGKKTDGLKTLKDWKRLDCSYEQIAIDFAAELPEDVVEQARKTLLELEKDDTISLDHP